MASFVSVVICIFLLFLHILASQANYIATSFSSTRVFNVLSYGAIPDGRTDNSQVFLKAWNEACNWNNRNGQNVVLVPSRTFMVNSVLFLGPCKSRMVFMLRGVLKAPSNPSLFFTDTWIGFRYIDGLVVKGGGTVDGQGHFAWRYNDCFTNRQCKSLPVSLRFDFVNNGRVRNLRSVNSKNAHFTLYSCNNFNITKVRLTAPDESPNTDGIKIGMSTNIKISRSIIGTGDDCIAMLSGTENVDISDVLCGPGHGISIGSLGNNVGKEFVKGVKIRNCTFVSTQNGLRIKTRPSPFPSFVSDVIFSGITMTNVNNPLIIDQQYCPQGNCFYREKRNAGVMIKDVTFRNIWGTSSSEVAINLRCSEEIPCENVKLVNINLAYAGTLAKQAISKCVNAKGVSYGIIQPSGCL